MDIKDLTPPPGFKIVDKPYAICTDPFGDAQILVLHSDGRLLELLILAPELMANFSKFDWYVDAKANHYAWLAPIGVEA